MSAVVQTPQTVLAWPNARNLLDQWRRDQQAIVLKINDRLQFEIKDDGSFQRLLELLERLDNIAAIQEGLDDVVQGRTLSLEEFKQQIRDKHGISD